MKPAVKLLTQSLLVAYSQADTAKDYLITFVALKGSSQGI